MRGIRNLNACLCMPQGWAVHHLPCIPQPRETYRSEISVYICTWWGSGIFSSKRVGWVGARNSCPLLVHFLSLSCSFPICEILDLPLESYTPILMRKYHYLKIKGNEDRFLLSSSALRLYVGTYVVLLSSNKTKGR